MKNVEDYVEENSPIVRTINKTKARGKKTKGSFKTLLSFIGARVSQHERESCAVDDDRGPPAVHMPFRVSTCF